MYTIVHILYYQRYNGTNKNKNQTDSTSESLTKETRLLDIYAVIIWKKAKCRQCFSITFLISVNWLIDWLIDWLVLNANISRIIAIYWIRYTRYTVNYYWMCRGAHHNLTVQQHSSFYSLHNRWHISRRRGNWLVFILCLSWTVWLSCVENIFSLHTVLVCFQIIHLTDRIMYSFITSEFWQISVFIVYFQGKCF